MGSNSLWQRSTRPQWLTTPQRILRPIDSANDLRDDGSATGSKPNHSRDDQLLDAYSNAVISVVDRVGASVVHISTTRQSGNQQHASFGSGVTIAPDGYILTNSHVVHDATELRITFQDGTEVSATAVGEDPSNDLAVVRADTAGPPVRRSLLWVTIQVCVPDNWSSPSEIHSAFNPV